jgi:hypothetical protein
MTTGRTTSASFLATFDKKVIALCERVSNSFRDGGLGLGCGKLRRDAIYTRGRGGKAPFSQVHKLPERFVIMSKRWQEHIESVKNRFGFTDTDCDLIEETVALLVDSL